MEEEENASELELTMDGDQSDHGLNRCWVGIRFRQRFR